MQSVCLFLLVIICKCRGISIPCYSNSTEIPCSAYYFRHHFDCIPAILAEKYPDFYNLTYGPPERPYDLSLPVFEKLTHSRYYAGVRVTITPPQTASIHFLKGFELRYKAFSRTEDRCILVEFSGKTLGISHRYTLFSLDIFPLFSGLYAFQVYSLPRPVGDEDTVDKQRQSKAYIPHSGYDNNISSSEWYTTISYTVHYSPDSKRGAIRYYFITSSIFHFQEFKVQLFKKNRHFPLKTLTLPWRSAKDTHIFSSLNPGQYKIKVTPEDTIKVHACVDKYGFPSSCTTTSTDNIILGAFPNASSSQIIRETTMFESNSKSTESTESKEIMIQTPEIESVELKPDLIVEPDSSHSIMVPVVAILGTSLLLLFMVVFTHSVYIRQHNKQDSDDEQRGSAHLERKARSVQIVYTVDNKFHLDAVEKLKHFLAVYFDIIVLEQKLPFHYNSENSQRKEKSSDVVDIIIFILSPTIQASYMADILSKECTGGQNILRSLLTPNTEIDRLSTDYVVVRFGYPEEDQHEIYKKFPYKTFSLMSDINRLLQYLTMHTPLSLHHNCLDNKLVKSKKNMLDRAISLAIKFYEVNMLRSEDSGYNEEPKLFSEKSEKLESISNVLENCGSHLEVLLPDSEWHITPNYAPNDHVMYNFYPPSDTESNSSTLAMQRQIQCLNQRNQDQYDTFHGEHMGYNGNGCMECISINSGKSV